MCQSCRSSRKNTANKCLVAITVFDTAENKPSKSWPNEYSTRINSEWRRGPAQAGPGRGGPPRAAAGLRGGTGACARAQLPQELFSRKIEVWGN